MKDAMYVVCAAIGLLLVGVGVAQIQENASARTRRSDLPATIREMLPADLLPAESPSALAHRPTSTGMVPVTTVLYLLIGYLLQIGGCALYAENRGRSAFFGLLGLLSPIGYVLLALLNPVPQPVPSKPCTASPIVSQR